MSLRQRLRAYKEKLRLSAQNLDAPKDRSNAWWHFMIFDHGVLRVFWHNFAEIAPGIFRANHPSPKRLETYKNMGFRSIINLRGASDSPHYQFEARACRDLGLSLIDVPGLTARQAPSAEQLLNVLHHMRTAERPTLIHCKSGADRTSLAAALYLLSETDTDIETARKHLSARFIHFKWTKTGILDHIFDTYAKARHTTGQTVEDWLKTSYDADRLQAEFEANRR